MSAAHRTPPPVPDTGRAPVPEPGRADELADGLVRVTAPNPSVMTGPGTNTYIVGHGDVAVVDPGPDDPVHLERVAEVVHQARGRVRWVLVTHTHPDHAPGAARLARATGAGVVGYGARAGFAPDVEVRDGWRLETGSLALRALHTPGHASDHICWLLEEARILLSGDHVMDGVTVVIIPPDGDMGRYVENLERLERLDPPLEAIAPGHGRLLGEPARVLAAVRAHRLAREAVVVDALRDARRATVDELVPLVYADVDAARFPAARLSLWAHLRTLVADGRAAEEGVGEETVGHGPHVEGADEDHELAALAAASRLRLPAYRFIGA